MLKVYPRVGGETTFVLTILLLDRGLSPRGRGNLGHHAASVVPPGSIPAWAGKPPPDRPSPTPHRVYPRVGGETQHRFHPTRQWVGLSPRGRGNHGRLDRPADLPGSIPAWAGKPWRPGSTSWTSRVYPRVGGETTVENQIMGSLRGLSPRGRGNHEITRIAQHGGRSIPAWAGKPRDHPHRPAWWEVYPRVGGETSRIRRCATVHVGLSPRGRGNHHSEPSRVSWLRSIPAWAGKPLQPPTGGRSTRVYPRVGGETQYLLRFTSASGGLSPRGRGNRPARDLRVLVRGSIPAWAGKPTGPRPAGARQRVYPRVGGETGYATVRPKWCSGLSPRGRGNLQNDHA